MGSDDDLKFQDRLNEKLKSEGEDLLDYVWGQKDDTDEKDLLPQKAGELATGDKLDLGQEQAIAAAATKRKRFNAGFTRDLKFILYWAVTLSLAAISGGLVMLMQLRPDYYYCFIGAALPLAVPWLIYSQNRRRFVILTPQFLMVGQGEAVRSVSWDDIKSVKEVRQKSKLFRWVVITDKMDRRICISSLIYPRFDLFMSVLRIARRYYEEGKDKIKTKRGSSATRAAEAYYGKTVRKK